MSEGFQFLDIVLFAMVAVFLALRLRSVLGKRTGYQRQRPDPLSQGRSPAPLEPDQDERDTSRSESAYDSEPAYLEEDTGLPPEPDDELSATLTKISIADANFHRDTFLEGARAAFDMIVNAFAEGDLNTLRGMLADDVFDNFATAIDDRHAAGEKLETTIVGIKSATIVAAELVGHDATVTIAFVSDQVNITLDEEDRVIAGDPNEVTEITDIWSFRRNIGSSDPNWTLVETGTQT